MSQAAAGDAARAQPRVVSLHQPTPSRASKIQEAAGQEKRRSLNAQEQLRASAPPAFQSLMQARGSEWVACTLLLNSAKSSSVLVLHSFPVLESPPRAVCVASPVSLIFLRCCTVYPVARAACDCARQVGGHAAHARDARLADEQ